MRNTLPTLSIATFVPLSHSQPASASAELPSQQVPTIRLINATPSATGTASGIGISIPNTSDTSLPPSSLAPRANVDNTAKRKKLVPKKSKLGLLGAVKNKGRAQNDFSDVVRRVGGTASAGRGGYEIYVDHTEDPDLEGVVLIKKKKSRLGLDAVAWGPTENTANASLPPSENVLKPKASENVLKPRGSMNLLKSKTKGAENSTKPKGLENLAKSLADEKDKWWSISRGRKNSKEQKDPKRSKSPESSRARFNSLDSGILLSSPLIATHPHLPYAFDANSSQTLLVPSALHDGTISSPTDDHNLQPLLAPPMESQLSGSGSLAIRAMRSMRSMARIGSWAQPRNEDTEKVSRKEKAESKKKEKSEDIGKKKSSKEKKAKEKIKEDRMSGSGFEVGTLDALPVNVLEEAPRKVNDTAKTLGKKKQSILGLGLPSSMKFGTVRTSSNSSSVGSAEPPMTVKRSSLNIFSDRRPSSTISISSSLRPMSTVSGISGKSSTSTASVKWDEEGLETVKEMRKKDRAHKRLEGTGSPNSASGRRKREESRKSSEGKKRPLVSDIFPDTQQQVHSSSEISTPSESIVSPKSAIINVEEATADGHGYESGTPIKRSRPRPVSEQMLGKSRPTAIYDDANGVLSALDAATNDLASLINRLDLEATPCSPDGSPIMASIASLRYSPSGRPSDRAHGSPISFAKNKRGTVESPLRKAVTIRASAASTSSLLPYSQVVSSYKSAGEPSNGNGHLIGRQIAPPIEFDQSPSLLKKASSIMTIKRPTHQRTLSPPLPTMDPPLVFQPLRPPKPRRTSQEVHSSEISSGFLSDEMPEMSTPIGYTSQELQVPSSSTFGDRPARVSTVRKRSNGEDDDTPHPSPTPNPVFKSELRHSRTKSMLDSNTHVGVSIRSEAKRDLGMARTMGSTVKPDVDPEDPASDIPDELQVLLSGTANKSEVVEETFSYTEPDVLTELPLQERVQAANHTVAIRSSKDYEGSQPVFHAQLYDEDANNADIEGSSDEDDTKKSFDFTGELKKLNESGASDRRSFVEQLENAFKSPARIDLKYNFLETDPSRHFLAPLVPNLPTATALRSSNPTIPITEDNIEDTIHSESQASHDNSYDEGYCGRLNVSPNSTIGIEDESTPNLKSMCSKGSHPSNGQLNVSFKFGGGQSRVISPSTVDSSSMDEDNSVLKSIYAQASSVLPRASDVAIPRPRPRLDSDSSFKRYTRQMSILSHHVDMSRGPSREDSRFSFVGFDSFDEVRRGFEFGPNRPAFYPPPGAETSRYHNKHDSVFSIASVSSYGSVIDAGDVDPFGYANSSRPPSDDMSISVDDTFSFIHKGRRTRVDSDASSFYFKPPPSMLVPIRRSHRIRDSMVSVSSNAPPVSLYNRSHGAHRRNDSSTSLSSVAYSYAAHGANGGRMAWAKHSRNDPSLDSIMSDYSAMRLGRPGLGDKMLDSIFDHGMPLSAISASPTQSNVDRLDNVSSYDSLIDTRRSLTREDSLFDNSGDKSPVSSDSGFFNNNMVPAQSHGRPFRPISVISMNSDQSSRKEDDTMISMLGGGHVRRKSIGSMIQQSPLARVEKRKPLAPLEKHAIMEEISPKKARVTEKPSIVSTTSSTFGGERMIKARKGVLERQSLEESCLVAEGEELASFAPEVSFLRPGPVARSRSDTCTSVSSGTETPPLSSDTSSISGGSQSSIDMGHLNVILSNVTYPMTRPTRRARARGHGHRHPFSGDRASRSSVYETIQEEQSMMIPISVSNTNRQASVPITDSVFIVDDTDPTDTEWDDDRGIIAMRRYFALKEEAHDTVKESRRIWTDTPFSLFALQSFNPPENPIGMQALLEHSRKNYGPLPSELRPRRIRSRTYSRPSPYPARTVKHSPTQDEAVVEEVTRTFVPIQPLQAKSTNIMTPAPALGSLNPFTPFEIDFDKAKRETTNAGRLPTRPFNTRRNALGWTKRSTGKSSNLKENAGVGTLTTPSDSLRINRPRPRGRPTPGNARAALPQFPQLRV